MSGTTEILLSHPSAVIPVRDVFVAGLLESAVQMRFHRGIEPVGLVYEADGETHRVEVDSHTGWEVVTRAAWDLVAQEEVDSFMNAVGPGDTISLADVDRLGSLPEE